MATVMGMDIGVYGFITLSDRKTVHLSRSHYRTTDILPSHIAYGGHFQCVPWHACLYLILRLIIALRTCHFSPTGG